MVTYDNIITYGNYIIYIQGMNYLAVVSNSLAKIVKIFKMSCFSARKQNQCLKHLGYECDTACKIPPTSVPSPRHQVVLRQWNLSIKIVCIDFKRLDRFHGPPNCPQHPLRVQSINSHYHPLSFYEVRGLVEFFFRLSFSLGRPRLLIFQFYIKDPFSVRTPCATQCKLIHKKDKKSAPRKACRTEMYVLGLTPSYPTISMMSTPASCACQSLDLKLKKTLG